MDVLVNFSFNNEVKLVKVTSQSKNLPSFGDFVEKVREKFNITNCIGFTNVYGAALEDDIFEAYVQKYSSHPDFIIFVKIQDESIATSDSPKELISTGKIVEVSSREFESHVFSASFPVEYKKEIQKPEKTSVLRKVAQIDDNLEMWMEDTKTKDSSHNDNSRESICGSISESKDSGRLANEEESMGEGDHDETGDLDLENYSGGMAKAEESVGEGDHDETGDLDLAYYSGGMANAEESVGEGDHDETGDLVLENHSDGMANEGVPMEDTDHSGGLQQQEKTIKKSNRKITLKELKAHFLLIEGEEIFQTATGEFLNLAQKRKIVATAVNFIKRKFGTFLPDRDMKVHVSQLIHKLFPEIDYKTIYNPTTKKGLLETKCRYLRRRETETTGKKKQQKRTQNPPALPTEPANEQEARKRIAFLKHASVKEQKPEMITMFKENYHHRRQNFSTLVEDYGNILKLLPELITYDYEVEHGSVDILAWFQKNGSKIEKFHDELTSGRKKQIKQVADEREWPGLSGVLTSARDRTPGDDRAEKDSMNHEDMWRGRKVRAPLCMMLQLAIVCNYPRASLRGCFNVLLGDISGRNARQLSEITRTTQ
ncbi:hypothetical protein DMENIID0001_141260 [Sergentomyia squamirostris]